MERHSIDPTWCLLEPNPEGEWVRFKDAKRPEFPRNLGFTLQHNPHKLVYQKVEDYLQEDFDRPSDWVSSEERERSIQSQELWQLQWYPDTPVGFHFLQASSLEALMTAVADR